MLQTVTLYVFFIKQTVCYMVGQVKMLTLYLRFHEE